MLKSFSSADKFLFVAAFISLVFSEILWFGGDHEHAIFVGLWVPSILAFGIYLKLLIKNNHE
jgi:hypothetical protein